MSPGGPELGHNRPPNKVSDLWAGSGRRHRPGLSKKYYEHSSRDPFYFTEPALAFNQFMAGAQTESTLVQYPVVILEIRSQNLSCGGSACCNSLIYSFRIQSRGPFWRVLLSCLLSPIRSNSVSLGTPILNCGASPKYHRLRDIFVPKVAISTVAQTQT